MDIPFVDMLLQRIENTFYASNTFVLSEKEGTDVWLVDCGDYAAQVCHLLNGRKVRGVLITHTHSDHIYGLNALLSDFPDAVVCTSEFGKRALRDTKLNVSKYHVEVPDFIINPEARIVVLHEGDEVDMFPGVKAQVLSTPGHDKSCLSYIIDDCLFTGDSYIPGERLLAIFPNSNKEDAKESCNRLIELSKNFAVCPGHGVKHNSVERSD